MLRKGQEKRLTISFIRYIIHALLGGTKQMRMCHIHWIGQMYVFTKEGCMVAPIVSIWVEFEGKK